MPLLPLDRIIDRALQGEVISFPTDTVPALAVIPKDAPKIFTAKKRPPDKPLILMAADTEELFEYVRGSGEERALWLTLTEKYWPGQLTLVLPASEKVPPVLNPLDPTTIGIRIPAHPVALALLSRTGTLATTSANLSGEEPLLTPAEIAATFPDVAVLESFGSDYETSQQPSTVAKWTGDGWRILRQGEIVIDG